MIKSSHLIVSLIMVLCLIGIASATLNLGSDGHNHSATIVNNAGHIHKNGVSTKSNTTNVITVNRMSIATSSPTGTVIGNTKGTIISGTVIDNTKKIAVYMPSLTSTIYTGGSGSTGTTQTTATYDPYCTSMFFEYNPDYLNDSTIATKLIKSNYDLLIVPMCEMNDNAATAINTYLASGGSVWFFNDPSLDESENTIEDRIDILGGTTYTTYNTIDGNSKINVTNTDDLTSGLPAQFSPIGAEAKWSFFRSLTGSGAISDFNYNVLMSNGDCALMVKYENPTTGARAIYSNADMFISGGTCSYFNAQQASDLFLKTKAWLLNMASNSGDIQVTYPNGDKQFTITIDDVEGASWENTAQLTSMETTHGVTPANVNTFFVIPDFNTDLGGLTKYSEIGDIHTLHCHNIADWTNSQDVSTYDSDIVQAKTIINNAAGVSDFGFTSWRYPFTSYCLNAQKAVADNGFMIESTNGRYTDGVAIGLQYDNNLMFPKQMLIDDTKNNMIELESTSLFDLDSVTGANYYQQAAGNMQYLKNVNFPSDFIMGGHYQSLMTVQEMTDAMGQILDDSKAAGTSYATLDMLCKYMTAVKSSTITASVNGGTTTVTVVNSKPITDFTLKSANGVIVSATCDGSTLAVIKDSNTGSAYVTKTISAGTHSFVIVATGTVPIPVNPVASFTSNITSGVSPLTVSFNSTSTNTKSVSWKFGDGSGVTATTNNTTHTFVNTKKNAANYTVTLTATGNNGVKSTATTIITVQPTPVIPVSSFTVSPKTGTTDTDFKFTDKSSNKPTSWSWDFGDGATGSENIVTHTYASAGAYTVTLTVGNLAGTNQTSKSIVVAGIPPKASFTYLPTPVKKGVVTTFTDTSTQNPNQWLWTFSDGFTANTPTVTHSFTKTGSATVTMTAYNNAGNNTVTKKISVGK